MDIKELRINNLVYGRKKVSVGIVKDIHEVGHITVELPSKCPISISIGDTFGIPLTDEWKTKLSFKQYPYEPENLNEGYYWSLQVIKGIYLTIEDGDDYAYLDYGLDFNGTKNLIKYQFVHEIQNVYNILKKEDITIK